MLLPFPWKVEYLQDSLLGSFIFVFFSLSDLSFWVISFLSSRKVKVNATWVF